MTTTAIADPLSDPIRHGEYETVLTRSAFLAKVSILVFGAVALATGVPLPASAHTFPSPACCTVSTGSCNCCIGDTCCSSGCAPRYSGCGPTGYGWYCCGAAGTRAHFCKDWYDADGHNCICAKKTQLVC